MLKCIISDTPVLHCSDRFGGLTHHLLETIKKTPNIIGKVKNIRKKQ